MSKQKWLIILVLLLLVALTKIVIEDVISQDLREKIGYSKLMGESPSEADFGANKAIVEWVDGLIMCESGGNKFAIGDNGKAHGILQFHEPTFWAYNEKYKILPDLERSEVPNVIFDKYIQKELTKRILLEKEGWRNWYNCSKIIGLDKADLNSL